MAKPIRATPTLRGQDAIRFIEKMIKEEKTPTKRRVNFIKDALKHTEEYEKMLHE